MPGARRPPRTRASPGSTVIAPARAGPAATTQSARRRRWNGGPTPRCLRTTHAAATACWSASTTRGSRPSRRAGTTTRRRRTRIPVVVACALKPPGVAYVLDGCVRVGGFHPGHDAYCQGRYLADNIASWALAGARPPTAGRRGRVRRAVPPRRRRSRALARSSSSQRSSPPFVGAATRSGCGWVRTPELVNAPRPRTPRRRSSTRRRRRRAERTPRTARRGSRQTRLSRPRRLRGRPRRLAARGVVAVRLGRVARGSRRSSTTASGSARPPPKLSGRPPLPAGPRRSFICSGAWSGGEFVRACADDGAGDDAALGAPGRWRALRGHGPGTSTSRGRQRPRGVHGALGAAESGGPIETRFASTRLDDCIDAADRELLAGAVGTPAPPPWLPQEKGMARHAPPRVMTRCTSAPTPCATSTAWSDATPWRSASGPRARAVGVAHLAAARPRGDRQPPDAPQVSPTTTRPSGASHALRDAYVV